MTKYPFNKMKIIVSGGWSYGNIGDEAIAKATQFEFNQIWPSAEYIYTAYNPEEFFKHHKINSKQSVHRIIQDNPCYDISLDNIEIMLDELKQTLFSSYIELFNGLDVIFVMSGGGFFLESWEQQFISRILEIFIADSLGAKVFIIGQSIGPFYTDKARILAKKALRLCTYINVRDISTYNFIKKLDSEIDIKLTCDIANDIKSCYLNKQDASIKANDKKRISMMLSGYSHHETAESRVKLNRYMIKIWNRLTLRKYKYEYSIKKLLRYIYERDDCNLQIVMSTDLDWDRDFIVRITRGLNTSKLSIFRNNTVDELCMAIKNSDYMISSKMHPLIIANSFGVPTIGISYNFKVDDFMKSIGRERFCFINRELQVGKVIDAFNRDVDYQEIKRNSAELKEKVRSIFQDMMNICTCNGEDA